MTPSTAKYHLKVFGQVKLARPDGTDVDSVLSRSKRLALLIYLAVSPRAFCRRDTVLGVFWPEFDQERARAALRKAVHFLRQELGDGIILARGYGEIGVDPEQLSCDVNDFEAALQKGDLESALGLYAGELLDGFYVSDAAEFEQWVEAKRRELKGKAARAVERLTNQAFAAHDPPTTARWAQEWTRLAPTDEAASRALMTAWDQAGERAKALDAYDELAAHLRNLELEPSPETLSLAAGMRQNNVEPLVDPVTDRKVRRPPVPPASRRRSLTGVALVIVVITIAAFGIARVTTVSSDDRSSVAVSSFTNLTDDSAFASLGAVYQRAIADGLAQVSRVRVLPFGDTAATPTLTVGGSFHRIADSLELVIEIVDHARGRTLPAPFPVRAPIADPAERADEVRRSVMGAVAYYTGLWNPTDPVRRPPSWDAYVAFQNGFYTMLRRRSRGGQLVSIADSIFRRVIELDSLYTEAYLLLYGFVFSNQPGPAAQRAVYSQLGRYAAYDSLVQVMRERMTPLTDLDRAVVNMMDMHARGDYSAMLRWAQETERLLPSWENIGILFAAAVGNQPHAELSELTSKIYSDWDFDWWLSWFWLMANYHLQHDYQGEADAVAEAEARPRVRFNWRRQELRARAALGDVRRVRELTQDLNPSLARRGGLEVRAHALERNDEEMLAESDRMLRWAVRWYDEAPDEWRRKVQAYWFLRLYDRIDEVVTNLEGMARDSAHLIDVQGMLGVAYARQGNHTAAQSVDRYLTEVDTAGLRGYHTLWRARIAAQLGDKDQAVQLLARALREGTWFHPAFPAFGSFWHSDPDFEPLRGYPPYERLIAPNQ